MMFTVVIAARRSIEKAASQLVILRLAGSHLYVSGLVDSRGDTLGEEVNKASGLRGGGEGGEGENEVHESARV